MSYTEVSYTEECLDRAEKGLVEAYTERFLFQVAVKLAISQIQDGKFEQAIRTLKAVDK